MYIMRKMNQEKKAATDAERAALLAAGYMDVTPAALHEDMSAEKEDPVIRKPVKKEIVPAGKNLDKARDSIKKTKTADTKQKKSVEAVGPADQRPVETEDSKEPESAEAEDSMLKETIEATVTPGEQQSVGAAGSAQEQSKELTDSVQQSPEASQNPD